MFPAAGKLSTNKTDPRIKTDNRSTNFTFLGSFIFSWVAMVMQHGLKATQKNFNYSSFSCSLTILSLSAA